MIVKKENKEKEYVTYPREKKSKNKKNNKDQFEWHGKPIKGLFYA